MNALSSLHALLDHLPRRLEQLPAAKLAHKPDANKWSAKEELGHLLDSAANNHQRIVRAQLEDKPAMPDYDGNLWVALHKYQQRDWSELIGLWHALNVQLLIAAKAVPQEAWSRMLTVGDSKLLTLRFVFEDYVEHMLHHLHHIGVQADDLIAKES